MVGRELGPHDKSPFGVMGLQGPLRMALPDHSQSSFVQTHMEQSVRRTFDCRFENIIQVLLQSHAFMSLSLLLSYIPLLISQYPTSIPKFIFISIYLYIYVYTFDCVRVKKTSFVHTPLATYKHFSGFTVFTHFILPKYNFPTKKIERQEKKKISKWEHFHMDVSFRLSNNGPTNPTIVSVYIPFLMRCLY